MVNRASTFSSPNLERFVDFQCAASDKLSTNIFLLAQPMQPHLKDLVSNVAQVEISPNITRLDISGPKLPNLSFYNLPGLISMHELAEDQCLVEPVKNSVIDHIQDSNCINLLALLMTDDSSNSNATVLIRCTKSQSSNSWSPY